MERPKPLIYVSGPISGSGFAFDNVRNGAQAGIELYESGLFIPLIPHLSFLLHFMSDFKWEDFMEMDKEYVRRSDGLLRLPGVSPGADIEVELARELLKPVAYSIPELTQLFYPHAGDVIRLPETLWKPNQSGN